MNKTKKEPPVRLYGIFGHPLAHTLSPGMQEAGFEAVGMKAFYLTLELTAKDFKKTMKSLPRLALQGFNLTIPYKQAVIPYLDRIDSHAEELGAVNTVYRQKGKWIGANTDVYGFLESLRIDAKFDPRKKNFLLLGAGGAARAVAYALGLAGAGVVEIANRHPDRVKKIVSDFSYYFPKTRFKKSGLAAETLGKTLLWADVVINATSVGLKPGSSIFPERLIPKAGKNPKLFYDLIYHRETELIKAARKKGHQACGGLGMLLFQGAKAFECWTGKKAPIEVMRKALLAGLEARKGH